MKIKWFESTVLSEKYCRIEIEGRPAIYVFPKDMTNTYALVAVRFGASDICFKPHGAIDFIRVPEGSAHFLEHRMFTDEHGSDAIEKFSALGADANAYTSYDTTVYMINTTDRFAEAYAELLRMVTRPNITEESVKRERGIIAEEIRMYEDDPESACNRNLLRAMYSTNPVRHELGGTIKSISNITAKTLLECHSAFYIPSNMVTIICGKVDPLEAAEIVCREIAPDNTPPCERWNYNEPAEPRLKRVSAFGQAGKPIISIGIKDKSVGCDPDEEMRRRILISIINYIIFSTSGDLYNELYNDGLITSSISYGHEAADGYSFIMASWLADEPEVTFLRFCRYVEKLRESGISKEDFERCRRVCISDMIGRYDSTEDIANSLIWRAFKGTDIFRENEIVTQITVEEANRLLLEIYDPSRFVMSVFFPGGDDKKN